MVDRYVDFAQGSAQEAIVKQRSPGRPLPTKVNNAVPTNAKQTDLQPKRNLQDAKVVLKQMAAERKKKQQTKRKVSVSSLPSRVF